MVVYTDKRHQSCLANLHLYQRSIFPVKFVVVINTCYKILIYQSSSKVSVHSTKLIFLLFFWNSFAERLWPFFLAYLKTGVFYFLEDCVLDFSWRLRFVFLWRLRFWIFLDDCVLDFSWRLRFGFFLKIAFLDFSWRLHFWIFREDCIFGFFVKIAFSDFSWRLRFRIFREDYVFGFFLKNEFLDFSWRMRFSIFLEDCVFWIFLFCDIQTTISSIGGNLVQPFLCFGDWDFRSHFWSGCAKSSVNLHREFLISCGRIRIGRAQFFIFKLRYSGNESSQKFRL